MKLNVNLRSTQRINRVRYKKINKMYNLIFNVLLNTTDINTIKVENLKENKTN